MAITSKTSALDGFPTTSLRPQESASIGSQLHRTLRSAIIRGRLKPGQPISEIEMSKRFRVSRQPVREAFIKLAEERLLEVQAQRSTVVRRISAKEVLDARHLREIIEVALVREVALRPDAGVVERLRAIVHAQEQVAPGDGEAFLELDDEFHRALALSAGREYAWRVTEGIKAQMNRVRFLAFDFATPKPQLVSEHGAIVDAIAAGDPDQAARCVEVHLRRLLTSLPIIAARYPEFFTEEPGARIG